MSQPVTARDIQFAHVARMILDELLSRLDGTIDASDWWQEHARETLTRRVYDIVHHVLSQVEPSALVNQPLTSVMRTIPDMTSWPDEDEAIFLAWLTSRPDPAHVEKMLTKFRKAAYVWE